MSAQRDSTLGQLLKHGSSFLNQRVDNAYSESLILLQHTTGKRKEYLIAHADEIIDDPTQYSFQQHLERRIKGEPIAYIVREKEFWSLPLYVDPQVLIPRPETELLVEVALEFLNNHKKANILDLGTGSGCIALALASEFPQANIVACDISQQCIDVATANAEQLNISNVSFVCSDWFQAIIQQEFDLIVSNPPYIANQDTHIEQQVRTFEPDLALFSEDNGMQALTHLIQHAHNKLHPGGRLILEHGWQQASLVNELLADHGYQAINSQCDLQGHIRVTSGTFNK